MLTNNVCTAQLAPARLFFLALQVLEFHTRRDARDGVAPLRSLFLSRDLPLVLTSPLEEPPIVLYSETSFCFILPSCPSFSLSHTLSSLCLFTAYYMRFRTFHLCRHDCSHGQTSNPIHCERYARKKCRRGSDESGQTAREQNDGREKNETMKGLKLIQLNEKRRRVGTRLIYFRNHPFALPLSFPGLHARETPRSIVFPAWSRGKAKSKKTPRNDLKSAPRESRFRNMNHCP